MNVGKLVKRCSMWYSDRIPTAHEGVSLTYRELNERINRLSNALLSFGLQKGPYL